jgi:hypothetical protein
VEEPRALGFIKSPAERVSNFDRTLLTTLTERSWILELCSILSEVLSDIFDKKNQALLDVKSLLSEVLSDIFDKKNQALLDVKSLLSVCLIEMFPKEPNKIH